MDNLTVRQKFILNNIVEKGPLTIKDLSQQIDVSSRTVLRETSAINEWLKQYAMRISESRGKLELNGNMKNLDKVREALGGIPMLWMLTQEQRQVLITAQLLLSSEPLKSAYFSYQFNVVEGTINFYLDKIEKWLKVKNLGLIRKRGYGLEIEGPEWNRRNAFMELIYNYKPINELLSFLYDGNNDYLLYSFFKVTFGEELIALVKGILKKLEDNNILKENDTGYFGAFLHMLMAILRTQNGSPIELPEALVSDVLSSNEFSFVKDMDKLFNESGINLSDNELAYLAIHLKGDKYIYKNNREFEELGVDLKDLVRETLYIIDKRLNTKISYDNQLILALAQHFNPALYRLTLGLQVRNPLINEIKEYYSELFETVDYACRLVFSKYNLTVPSDEVGYITMHIGAAIERQQVFKTKLNALIICPNGLSTAKILYNKIKNNFKELDRIDVCSLRNMNEKISQDYDIVLSTVKIDKGMNGDIVEVSPFLPNRDIEKIAGLIKAKKGEDNKFNDIIIPSSEDDEDDFEEVNNMLKNFQLKNLNADNIKDSIKGIVKEMHNSNIITSSERIAYLINKREDQGSVVIPGSHVALIHIRAEEIEAPFVGTYRLKNFIKMKSIGFSFENVDTFFVMLARKDESNYILELLGRISIALSENDSFKEIVRLGHIKDIRNELIDIINREEL